MELRDRDNPETSEHWVRVGKPISIPLIPFDNVHLAGIHDLTLMGHG